MSDKSAGLRKQANRVVRKTWQPTDINELAQEVFRMITNLASANSYEGSGGVGKRSGLPLVSGLANTNTTPIATLDFSVATRSLVLVTAAWQFLGTASQDIFVTLTLLGNGTVLETWVVGLLAGSIAGDAGVSCATLTVPVLMNPGTVTFQLTAKASSTAVVTISGTLKSGTGIFASAQKFTVGNVENVFEL